MGLEVFVERCIVIGCGIPYFLVADFEEHHAVAIFIDYIAELRMFLFQTMVLVCQHHFIKAFVSHCGQSSRRVRSGSNARARIHEIGNCHGAVGYGDERGGVVGQGFDCGIKVSGSGHSLVYPVKAGLKHF